MSYHLLFAVLVVISALSSYINYKLFKLPKSIGMTITTLIISIIVMMFLKLFPSIFTPINNLLSGIDFRKTVLEVMLSYLLFAGALHVNTIDLKKNLLSIVYLASFGVVASTIVTGLLIWWVSGLISYQISLPYCLLFGALISPTDPIAVLGVLKTTKAVPKKIKMRITGEALFNDAAGILIFISLLSVFFYGDEFSITHISLGILHEAVGGIVFGAVIGFLAARLLKNVDDKQVAITITLAVSSAGYILAQNLGVSAPISMVIAGLVIGHHMKKERFKASTIVTLDNFWELIDEILNCFLFVLIGLEMLTITFHIESIILGVLGFIVIFISRYISVSFPNMFRNIRLRRFYWRENVLMTWGGIRGGISIALALSIPDDEVIVSLTYVVVILSIVFQGASFKWIINKVFPQQKHDNKLKV
ncbi:MAG: sodium:proton antiporter [Gammaproteobacteria bacterium]|nr:MAG: sodium:proton antiporter [Gammaproteobacteria bacterium]UTW43816.1 sodium:proton antiporter [bacterium SCSIO 12844]